MDFQKGKSSRITMEPSSYIIALRRRIHELEERGRLVDQMYGFLVEKGLITVDDAREMDDNGGSDAEMSESYEKATIDIFDIGSTENLLRIGNAEPVVLLRRLEEIAAPLTIGSCHQNMDNGSCVVPVPVPPTGFQAFLDLKGDDIVDDPKHASGPTEVSPSTSINVGVRSPSFNEKWKCIDCDKEYLKRSSLYRHCQGMKPRHGRYCIVNNKFYNMEQSWQRHLSNCPEHHLPNSMRLPSFETLFLDVPEYTQMGQSESDEDYQQDTSSVVCLDDGDVDVRCDITNQPEPQGSSSHDQQGPELTAPMEMANDGTERGNAQQQVGNGIQRAGVGNVETGNTGTDSGRTRSTQLLLSNEGVREALAILIRYGADPVNTNQQKV